MNIVNLSQGSTEWLEWRRNHIGASDVPVIMGVSEFSTAEELFLVKTGRKEPFRGNFATERGQMAEPKIRALYEEQYLRGAKTTAPVAEWDKWPVMSASFDALHEEMGIIAEFKYPSALKHDMAKQGKVPPAYADQIQAQLLVAGLDTCHYVSYNGKSIEVVVVKADKARQAEIEDKCRMFWACVETDTWNFIGSEKKFESPNLELISKRYIELMRLQRQTEDEMKIIKKHISDIVQERRATFFGLELVRSERAGGIDYASIPELQSVDLNAYRKPPVEMVMLKEIPT